MWRRGEEEEEGGVFTKRFSPPTTRRGGKFNILWVGTSLAAQREIPPRLVLRRCQSVIVAGV